ncbi:hypothetical protein Anapl_10521 [Anas platyrhynchos]|uniref:Uncharacterized protein n=1 Tax=Anas platyrhynchos TaxID=8839 RepID=R0KVX1_ANAPL|nr:hypothetical protein Anapl_10521 [Anas platyrhynchos]
MPRCKANVTFRKLPLRNKHSITRFVLEHTNFPLTVQTLKPMQGYVTQPCLPQLALKLGPHSLLQMQGEIARSLKSYRSGQNWINIYASKLSYQIPAFPLGVLAGNTRRKAFLLEHSNFQLKSLVEIRSAKVLLLMKGSVRKGGKKRKTVVELPGGKMSKTGAEEYCPLKVQQYIKHVITQQRGILSADMNMNLKTNIEEKKIIQDQPTNRTNK